MKIVLLDSYAANPGDLPMDVLLALGDIVAYDDTPAELVIERASGADAILINKVRITDEVMAQLPSLKYIGVQATGYNVVDVDAAHRRGIVVTNVPAYSTMSVAQLVFAHLLNITNAVGHYADDARRGSWASCGFFCYWDRPLIELDGKTLGIVGYGNIGRQVERIALAFGMRVIHASARDREAMFALLAESDVVTLHCPATAETMGMVDNAFLAAMRPSAILINTARGQLVNEHAIALALRENRLQAYCADVMTVEPPSPDNELIAEPHAYFTPHLAWATKEARTRLQHVVADNLRAFIQGHPQNMV
ncbi:MAG: D-2-hydroxyacid dehydrogenase [Bacteroidaceae bacterium]|nr:D-2-hydroxyacid dehydrogenase [Bacteroidaceae bacterium]